MHDPTSDRYDVSSLPRPGSEAMPCLPSREPIGNAPFRPARTFGPYVTTWISSDWSPLYKGRLTGRKSKPSKKLGHHPVGMALRETRTPQEQISDRRREFRYKLQRLLDTIEVCKHSNLNRSRIPYLELQANETQFRIDELDVMQHFWHSIVDDHYGQLVDSDFVNEVSKARQTVAANREHRNSKKPLPPRFAKPGETAYVSNGIRPTNAIERGESDAYWEQENN